MPHDPPPSLSDHEVKTLAQIGHRLLCVTIKDGRAEYRCGPVKVRSRPARRLIEGGLLVPADAALLPGEIAQSYRFAGTVL